MAKKNMVQAQLDNLKPIRTKKRAREIGAMGGKKSGEVVRRRKSIAEALKAILYSNSELNPDKIVLDEWLEAVVIRLLKNPDSKDLKIVAEVLGELVQKQSIDADVKADIKARLFDLPSKE